VILPELDLSRCTLTVMKRIIELVLTVGLLSSAALAQTTEPVPEPKQPVPVVAPSALTSNPASNPFGVSLTAGLNPGVLTVALDYDVTPNINVRFGVSPSPQVLELGIAYAFRTTADWRIYGIASLAYRFTPSPEPWSRVVGTLGVGLESPLFLFWNSPNRPPIWNRLEFGISSLDETKIGYYYSVPGSSYVPTYPGPGIFFRYGTVIRF
jgi:hypothetical protein